LVDFASSLTERVLNTLRGLRTGLEENETVFTSEGESFFGRNLALRLEIALVSHKNDQHFAVAVLLNFFKPLYTVLETRPPCDVVDKQGANGPAVVAPGDAPERFLAGCVPNLQLHTHVLIYFDHARAKLHADGEIMGLLKALISKLQQQTRLPD
jgi:hypothetical protein